MPIKIKLTIIVLALVSIPLIMVSIITFDNYKNSLEANRFAQLNDLSTYRADLIEEYFAGLKTSIEISQGFYNIRKNLPLLVRFAGHPENPAVIAAKKMLSGQLRQMQSVSKMTDIMLVGPEGRVVYSNMSRHYGRDLSAGNDAERMSFAKGKTTICFSDIYFDASEDNRYEMLVAAPATDSGGRFSGVIAFEVDMTPVYKIIQDVTGLGSTGEVLVGRKIGDCVQFLNPLRHDPGAALKRKARLGDRSSYPIQQAVQGRTGSGVAIDYRGEKVIAAWRYIPDLDWGLVAKIDLQEAFADVFGLRNLMLWILVAAFLLSGIIAFSIAASIARPVEQLIHGTEIIGSGNLEHRVGTDKKDEIGRLSRSFDRMADDLKLITASHDELDREVEERRRAEEKLKLSNKELDDSRNAALNLMDDALMARKEVESSAIELRKSREDLNRAQAVARIGSWRLNLWNNTLAWSDENYRLFHASPGIELNYEAFLAYVHPDDRDYVDKKWNAAISGEPYDIEHRIVVEGDVRWVRETGHMEFDDEGILRSGFGTTQDITERKQLETELAEKSLQLENLVTRQKVEITDTRESLYVATRERLRVEDELDHRQQALEAVYSIATANDSSFTAMNDQVVLSIAKILSAPYVAIHFLAETRKVRSSRLYNGGLSHDSEDAIANCIIGMNDRINPDGAAGNKNVREFSACKKCFRTADMRSYAGAAIFNRHEEVQGIICVLDSKERVFDEYDVRLIEIFAHYLSHEQTQRDLESQLIRSNELRVLGQLTSGVAHEVRNPLNGIMAIMSALSKELSDAERFKPYLSHMENQVVRLTALMEDLLALGRPIREEKKTNGPIVILVGNALATWQQSVPEGREIRFVKPENGEQGPLVHADSAKITQAVVNLLENAHQHSPKDQHIDIAIEMIGDDTVRILIKDNGPGISEEIMPRVFEPFFTTRKGGTGLGLSIVKHIVESHGGTIVAKNNEGDSGTTFCIDLPVSKTTG